MRMLGLSLEKYVNNGDIGLKPEKNLAGLRLHEILTPF